MQVKDDGGEKYFGSEWKRWAKPSKKFASSAVAVSSVRTLGERVLRPGCHDHTSLGSSFGLAHDGTKL